MLEKWFILGLDSGAKVLKTSRENMYAYLRFLNKFNFKNPKYYLHQPIWTQVDIKIDQSENRGLPRNENELHSYISLSVALTSSSYKDGDTRTKFVLIPR
jgi:hypothetical protein